MVLSTIIEFFIPQAALSMVVCLSLFKLSSATIGRASWSNAWLFNDLVVLQPTEESVALIAGVGNQQHQRMPKTLEERMDALELSSARILPGMLTRAALRSEDNYYLWRWLDAAVIFAVTCLFGLLLRWLVGWYQVLIHQETACCNDMECWSEWSDTIMASTPIISFMVIVFVTSLWKVATLSSRLPPTSRMRYPPSCYLAGFCLGLATLWLCYTPILLQSWNIQLQEALDELSSRWLLWLRMVFMSYHDTEREQYWREIFIHVAKLLIAGVCACTGFALADPLSVTIRAIIYQWYNLREDPGSNPFEYFKNQQQYRGNFGKYWSIFWRIHVRVAVCSTLLLPLALLGTYLSGNSSIGSRVTLSWIFVYMMATLCKPLLQGYLQQSLADITTVLAQSQNPEADRITHPFRYRMDRLIRVGGQIIVFPLLVTALLTSGHACRCGTSESLSLYPVIFPLDNSHISIKTWQMSHARTLAKGSLVWSLTSSKSFTTCNDLDALQGVSEIDNVLIRNATQLLESKPTIPTTFFKGLRGLQKLARRALREPPVRMALLHDNPQLRVKSSKDKATIAEVHDFVGGFADLSSAMIRHQHVTSTVIVPVLDLLGFVLCVLWVATYLLHVWTYWRTIGGIHSSTLFKVRRE